MIDIRKEIQDWILSEEKAGRRVDINRIDEHIQKIAKRHNGTPRSDLNGLSPEEMYNILYYPFSDQCIVGINHLEKDQYNKIPLVRQTLFLLNTLGETDLKLTKLGWLPLKIVSETYHLGQPERIIEDLQQKRINEYDAKSVWMARATLDLLGWIKTRKGVLSLTAKGEKALSDIDASANEILRFSLTEVGLDTFDGHNDDRIGNTGIAYSVWLLNKFGPKWHSGSFYQEHYQKVLNHQNSSTIYETRVFNQLFYWLGIVEKRLNLQVKTLLQEEYKKTVLLSTIFSFKKV